MNVKVNTYSDWATQVVATLHCDKVTQKDANVKRGLFELMELERKAQEEHLTSCVLYEKLISTVQMALKYSHAASKFVAAVACKHEEDESLDVEPITLTELTEFVAQISQLPCSIPETYELNELLKYNKLCKDMVVEFLQSPSGLAEIISKSHSLTISLPECDVLHQRQLQNQWLDEVRIAISSDKCLSSKSLWQLIDNGLNISPHPCCELMLHDLQNLLTKSMMLEDRAKCCLLTKASLIAAHAIIDEASHVPVYLPIVSVLKDATTVAMNWTTSVSKFLKKHQAVYMNVLENKAAEAQLIPLHLECLSQLESYIFDARAWSEQTSKTFLKKHSTLSLLEVLSPRTDIDVTGVNKLQRYKQHNDLDAECSSTDSPTVMSLLSHITVDFMPDLSTLMSAFHNDTVYELDAMTALRAYNSNRMSDVSTEKFCLCRQVCSYNMLQCELCKDLFHADCVAITKPYCKSSSVMFSERFLCPMCVRSKRPRLDTVLSLLVSLQKLPVRIAAGELLQLLAERALSWQDRAHRLLAVDSISVALARIGDKIPQDHSGRNTAVAELQHQLLNESHRWIDSQKYTCDMESVASFEHAYSSVSKHNSTNTHQSQHKLSPVAGLLTPELYARLKQLIVEGDLLEVTLDETQLLCTLWKSCRQSSADCFKSPEMSLKEEALKVKLETAEEHRKKKRKYLEVRSEDSRMELLLMPKKLKSGLHRTEYGKLQKEAGQSINDSKKNKLILKRNYQKEVHLSVSEDVAKADNSEEDCSANLCFKPTGQEVDWVQCDACQLWFHLLCVGLTKLDVASDKDYLCQVCYGNRMNLNYHFTDESRVLVKSSASSCIIAAREETSADNTSNYRDNTVYLPPDMHYEVDATEICTDQSLDCHNVVQYNEHDNVMVYIGDHNKGDGEGISCTQAGEAV